MRIGSQLQLNLKFEFENLKGKEKRKYKRKRKRNLIGPNLSNLAQLRILSRAALDHCPRVRRYADL